MPPEPFDWIDLSTTAQYYIRTMSGCQTKTEPACPEVSGPGKNNGTSPKGWFEITLKKVDWLGN
jgi:hypothetical protein